MLVELIIATPWGAILIPLAMLRVLTYSRSPKGKGGR